MIVQGNNPQDSTRPRIIVKFDNQKLLNDSVFLRLDQKKDSNASVPTLIRRSGAAEKSSVIGNPDTTSVCTKGKIAAVTFHDSGNLILEGDFGRNEGFPGKFIEANNDIYNRNFSALIKNLKDGEPLSERPINNDWVIAIIMVCLYLFSLLNITSKSMRPELTRFFLFRGINDPGSRDMSLLFNWQSTLLNLISFLIIGLFLFCIIVWYEIVPERIPEILLWFICSGATIISITTRHIICTITGNMSGRKDIFNDYILNVYRSYRFSSLVLFILVILILYTETFAPPVYFITGGILTGSIYLFRVTRLLINFLRQDISVFYLILYLCALEILPVLISLKYFSGLV